MVELRHAFGLLASVPFLPAGGPRLKVLLFANTDWYLYNFRRSLALALRERGAEVLLVSPAGDYGVRLEQLGFRWIAAPMQRRSLNPVREIALVDWLRRVMARERIDLVHSFTIKCAVYGSLAARAAGVPARVNAVAGMGYVFTSTDFRARLLRPVVRSLLRHSLVGRDARVILQNSDDVNFFQQEKLVTPDLIRLIPGSGVDCQRFTPGETREFDGLFRVLLPARLLWDKGIAEYEAAARQVRARDSSVRFILAGESDSGNPAAVAEQQASRWQAEGTLDWLGHVEDMPRLFQSVDAVVLPSYREGLPKGLAEAAACGLPLITTDVPGCREVVSHEVDGLLVPVKDSAALADAILRLRADATLRKRLGAAARLKALQYFDERSVLQRTLAVYEELLDTGWSPRAEFQA